MKNQFNLKDISEIFEDVQKSKIFNDQKAMADVIPLYPVSEINSNYKSEKNSNHFNLKDFVNKNFKFDHVISTFHRLEKLPINEHIEKLWDELTRTAFDGKGTLLDLPKPYNVPGGRFNEFFYWDSFYVMLGLQVSGRIEMMRNIVDNCAYLIHEYGFVPNASRSYFLSRSQPPYFSMMLELLVESTKNDNLYVQYFETLKKEYDFWMNGGNSLENGQAFKHVLKTQNGDIMNRYYDDENEPRPESYMIDVEDFENSSNPEFYRNIRSACESGWDFSSRWFEDNTNIKTIYTLELAQVDLNCLLWHLESSLSKAASVNSNEILENQYAVLAEKRKQNIEKYFWDVDSKIYRDFNFVKNSHTESEHVASLYPLFLKISDQEKAKEMSHQILKKFLHDGGLVTTTKESGQQWDFPNAWAPNQWIGYSAMKNYGFFNIAEKIKNNWCNNVERVYENTGKLMEKYNAVDTTNLAGGGEYPNQDGFGWTNGVYAKMKNS